MQFPDRQILKVPTEPSPPIENLKEELDIAIVQAKRFMRSDHFTKQRLAVWQKKVIEVVMSADNFATTAKNACLGYMFSMVSQVAVKSNFGFGYEMGTEGQRRMTLALTEMNERDRLIYVEPSFTPLKIQIMGARSVARIAAALTEEGAICQLTTSEEDAILSLDLLCEHQNNGACLQAKTGWREVRQVFGADIEEDNRFVKGTKLFNLRHQLDWKPIMVHVTNNIGEASLINTKLRKQATEILQLMHNH